MLFIFSYPLPTYQLCMFTSFFIYFFLIMHYQSKVQAMSMTPNLPSPSWFKLSKQHKNHHLLRINHNLWKSFYLSKIITCYTNQRDKEIDGSCSWFERANEIEVISKLTCWAYCRLHSLLKIMTWQSIKRCVQKRMYKRVIVAVLISIIAHFI